MKNNFFNHYMNNSETIDDISELFADIMLSENLTDYDFEAMYAEETGVF